ncbi:hypothetical protein N865_09395 [Intrasporangium oryzae NRRL B-24470]|uniref:Uncharacterized protein n=1 Tax=Intrasporangium oryzae NRRL B-24470 TaxID=1386089 RepID=W9GFT1_9MICO|nr:hypothetical protein [Intrasporangium oryzae]EWT03693.1 hypothetical protein N865_09395 [Intrasporangium oryzae NRRL B-24470]
MAQAALAALLLLLTAGGTAQAASPNPECAVAALLIQQGKPQQAEGKIRAASLIGECAAELASARDQTTLAANLAEKARAELAVKRWADASTWAASALTLDANNELAKTVAASAKRAATAEAAQQADLAAQGKSQLQKLLDQWNTFYEEQLSPLASLFLPFLAILAALLVAARLLVLLVPAWQEADDRSEQVWRHWIVIAGAASLVIGAALVSVGASDVVTAPLSSGTALVLLALVVAAGVGAYLLGELAYRRGEGASGRSEQDERSWPTPISLTAAGIGLFAVGAVALLARLSGGDTFPPWMDAWGVIILGVVVAALGVVLTAWWLATRIRLEVKFNASSGTERATRAGAVVAYLNELGGEKPKGLEVPGGSDVTALDGAFATMPENAALRVLKSFITALAGFTPWVATIQDQDGSLAILVRRNGRSEDSAVIDPVRLLPQGIWTESSGQQTGAVDDGKAETDKTAADQAQAALQFAAAHILTTMAEHHPSIRIGLAGASSWRSIGLQYIAASGAVPEERKQEVLALAVDEDPGNLAALLAFRHALDRRSQDYDTLVAYRDWLRTFERRLGPIDNDAKAALRLRVRYTRASIALNAVYASPSAKLDVTSGALPRPLCLDMALAKNALRLMDHASAAGSSSPELRHFCAQFSADVEGARYLTGLSDVSPEPGGPYGMYNLACGFASRNDIPWPGAQRRSFADDDAKAVSLLRSAGTLSTLKTWMPNDPQLARFRERTAYQNEFLADPRTDFFELSPVKPYASDLKASGFGQVSLISRAQPSELALGTATASPTVRRQIVELASLHTSLTDYRVVDLEELALEMIQLLSGQAAGDAGADPTEAPLSGWEVEIVDQLLQRGIATTFAVGALGPQLAPLATEMAERILTTCKPGEGQTAETAANVLAAHVAAWSLTV